MANRSSEGMGRAALATLCAAGGFAVGLRLPGPAASGVDAEQLGLATPVFQDVPIGPAAWRKAGVDTALLLSAEAVTRVAGVQGFGSAEDLFQSAIGVVVSGVLYAVTGCEALTAGATPCAYRVAVAAAVWV